MVHSSIAAKAAFSAAIVAAICCSMGGLAEADDTDPVSALPSNLLPPLPQKMLPPRHCPRCSGPAPSAPCFDTHRGFLYYGSYAWDDDPVNGFNDCPGGRCGYPGAMLSLGWIRLHQPNVKAHVHRSAIHQHGHQHGSPGCPTCSAATHHPAVGSYSADDRLGGTH